MPSLFLHAVDLLWCPSEPGGFVSTLRDVGLLGAAVPSAGEYEFLAGDQFLQRIMFLGCAPQVRLNPDEPGEGQALCFVRLRLYDETTFLSDEPFPAVRCPGCRAPAEVSAHSQSDALHGCAQCGKETALAQLDWRRGAGYARCFIEVCGIYPHEAVPSDRLLAGLADMSGGDWVYFYRR
ncbi:MAG TPA: hypothetical protein ENJ80_03060 [Gammaproteobacteria bacterium]|nr:hypothetical protein [Gammaproteobacteria bacterium]